MGEAVGEMLPAAVAVALSPLPIIAVVLVLVSPRGRARSLAYLTGQVVGVAAVGAIVLVAAGAVSLESGGRPATWASILRLLLGLGLLALAVSQWRGRPRARKEPELPAWLEAFDTFTPARTARTGALLAAVNPKNLILVVAGMAAVAQAGIPAGEQAVALLVFTAIGSLGVATPVVLAVVLGERSTPLLARLKSWLGANAAAIMAVVLILIAAKLIGDAIAGLAA